MCPILSDETTLISNSDRLRFVSGYDQESDHGGAFYLDVFFGRLFGEYHFCVM